MQTLYGVQDVDPVATDTARSFGFSRAQRLLRVTLPSAVPYIATGLRIASAVALILAVTAELVIGAPGLGREINLARQGGNVELMYALIIATGLLGLALNVALHARRAARAALAPVAARERGADEERARWASRSRSPSRSRCSCCGASGRAGSDTYYFPPLTDILETFADTWLFERVGSDVVPSLVRLGARLRDRVHRRGGARAARSASRRALRRAADPIVQFLRSIPPPALLPFAILVLGVGTSMKVFIIAFVCLWPVLLNTIDGVAGVDPTLRETARVYGIGTRDRRAARDAAGRGAADLRRHAHEPVAGADPDGDLRDGRQHQRHRLLRAAVAAHRSRSRRCGRGSSCSGILGYVLNAVFVLIERRVLRWHRGARASALS